jgi:metal-responsive CopG/Arc/MetJ family transcriptional regulator
MRTLRASASRGGSRPLKFPTKLLIGIDDDLLRSIDDWRRKQPDLPSRAEAIRRLIGQALKPPELRPRKR